MIQKLKNNWLFLLLIAQPLLDVIAYWTQNEAGTVSGYIRLAIMLGFGGAVFLNAIKKKKVWVCASFAAVASVFLLHIVNCALHGYTGVVSDWKNILRMAFLPVMAICCCDMISSRKLCDQAVRGILCCFLLEGGLILLSCITGTATSTYSEGFGISGWVISDNRCCHSDILALVCMFAAYFGASQKKIVWNVLCPVIVFTLLYSNGTRACYMTLYAIMVGYPAFLLIRSILIRKKPDRYQTVSLAAMLAMAALACILYPVSPRNQMDVYKNSRFDTREQEFAAEMADLGYDIYSMPLEEKLSDPVVHDKLVYYYKTFVYGEVDILGRVYDFDRIIRAYDGTISAAVLGDTRDMKQVYVGFIFHDSDLFTRLFGIEYDSIGAEKGNDLENDWYAIAYYLGYYGLAVYVLLCAVMLLRILCLLKERFRTVLTDRNFCLLMCFAIELGLGYFSGQIFRRPNASIYLAVVSGMIFCETALKMQKGAEKG